MLDWPIDQLEVMTQAFTDRLFVVYISPPSISVLRQRLAKDGRDKDGARLKSAMQELQRYWSSEYTGLYNMEVVSEDNEILKVAATIYASYLKSF